MVKAFASLDDERRDDIAECRRAEYVGVMDVGTIR